MKDREPGPQVVWLVRHGESMGNVADAHAQQAKAGRLELDVRDPDVPLSDTGRSQAEALGKWLAELPEDQRPTAALSSPFKRALTTAELATANLGIRVRTDERLRERDFGAFDGMTGAGIREQFPTRPSAATCSASSTTGRRAGRAGPTSPCESAVCSRPRACATTASG